MERSTERFEGWAADPTGAHEARYFVDGHPTTRVRDGGVESSDAPPDPTPSSPAHAAGPAVAGAPPAPVAGPGGAPWTQPAPGSSAAAPAAPWAGSPPSGGEGWDHFVGGGEPPRGRGHRRRRLTVTLAVVVLAGVAVGVVVAGGSHATSPQSAVVDSITSTLADRSAQVTMDTTSHTPFGAVTESGSGVVDFGHSAMQLSMDVAVAGNQVQLQVLYLAGVIYERVPQLSQLLPGKSWMSLDFSSLQQAGSADPGALAIGGNPTAIVRLLGQHKNKVESLGPSTVDGTPVQGYAVTLDPAAIQAEIAQAHLPSWMESIVSHVDLSDASLTVDIDGSGLLRRYTSSLTETLGSVGTVSVDQALVFSHYGTPVTVSAPPPGECASLQQLLQAAASALGGGDVAGGTTAS